MIAFRHVDQRFPFLREESGNGDGRWNRKGELTHYFADTPDGAWAEFLRHENISDPADLAYVRRSIWAVDIGAEPPELDGLTREIATGDSKVHKRQRDLFLNYVKRSGKKEFSAPSAALQPGGACGWRVDGGLTPGPSRDGKVFVLYGSRPDLVGWAATVDGRPPEDLLGRVRFHR